MWWDNDEALPRLTVLWRGWEAARKDSALGTSAWWINYANPHMSALLSLDGPFAGSPDEHLPGGPCPTGARPRGLFDMDRQPAGIYDDAEY
jgi:hypothetical protein